MIRRYLGLFLIAALAGLGATLLARGSRAPVAAPAPAAGPAVTMAITLGPRDLSASTERLPLGASVALTVSNASGARARLRLSGYEDVIDTGTLEAGAADTIHFVADRPGDRFAWLVGDELRGRLDIVGSHLEEGHR
jgi:hypothetical protein